VVCPADLTASALAGSPRVVVPDARASGDDFLQYLTMYASGLARTSCMEPPDFTTAGAMAGQPGHSVPDGVLSTDDFFYFLELFARAC